jgi:hypothetical protein
VARLGADAVAAAGAAVFAVTATSAFGDSADATAAVRSPPPAAYTVVAAPYRPVAHLNVTYSGSGTWATTYHATPPNPGGMPDTNDAADSSTQRWDLDYLARLTLPVCGRSTPGRPNRCSRLVAPRLARGPTSIVGSVDHTHIDGLYKFDDASDRCQLADAPPPATPVIVPIHVIYDARRQAITLVPADPIAQALSLIAPACSGYVDGIDGLAANYFTPGFSFSSAYGADRWFTPRSIAIPLATLHRATRVTVTLGPTAAGTPPANCAVRTPAVEHCHTAGAWRGVLTLSAVP